EPDSIGRQRAKIRTALHGIVEKFDVIQDSTRVDLSGWKTNAHRDYATILGLDGKADLNSIINKMRELGFSQNDMDYLLDPIESS
ncbi:MAG: hypothetical protein AAB802_02650, partial [Patescibacteria group bacterium]